MRRHFRGFLSKRFRVLLLTLLIASGGGVAYAECEGIFGNSYVPPAPSVAPSTVSAGGTVSVGATGLTQASTYYANLIVPARTWWTTIGTLPAPDGTGTIGPQNVGIPLGLVSGAYALWLSATNGSESSGETTVNVEGDAETDSEDIDEAATGDGETTVSGEELQRKRAEFESQTRPAYWRKEAQDNPGKYSESDLQRMREGKPPIGSDGHPVELHHKVPLKKGRRLSRSS